ncbi:hypothetical protein F5Y19DRAFT_379575 [Xylariaceae sp. FL1651]|nr:hypothetical protein F5Y19DRAFT_379575 [Xylariaceae sp. FL1651]
MEITSPTRGTKRKYSGYQIKRALSGGNDSEIAKQSNTIQAQGTELKAWRSGLESEEDVIFHQPPPNQMASGARPRHYNDNYYQGLYSTESEFAILGQKYPEFGAVLKDGTQLDFTDPAAVMQLTKTLLKEDFGLQIDLPPDRLCPPVPNRHNYLLWLKDLLDSSSSSYREQYEPERRVTGLDIGTGASLIYPLLGCVQRPWHFIATDVDFKSLSYARLNARLNNLESRIRIVGRDASASLIPLDELNVSTIDFVMVNPPFYASDAELLKLAAQKSRPPYSACTGAPVEMVCEGGEIGFVQRMINESLVLRERVQWYTAMLGKQSSLKVLIDTLRRHHINNYAVKAFIQGNKTRRWAIGWSFVTRRPSLSASRGHDYFATKRLLPPITEIIIGGPFPKVNREAIPRHERALCDAMESLDLVSWFWDKQRLRGVGFADGNVWSRAYRRRRAAGDFPVKQLAASSVLEVATCAFGFSVSLRVGKDPGDLYGSVAVVLRWLQGDDHSLFESFVGMIRGRLETSGAGSTRE